jgi:hypothetical protein
LWKCSAMRVAASRPGAVRQSTDRPFMHSACPPRCPSSGAAAAPNIETSPNMQSP